MDANVIFNIKKLKAELIILDIDGTLKDLCKEHSEALNTTLDKLEVTKNRKKLIRCINKIAMTMVKTGFFSTNHCKQSILLKTFAVLSGKKISSFNDEYFRNYTNQICLFEGITELLTYLNRNNKVYFSTTNKQNYNLESCGIPQERIVYTKGKLKSKTYSKIIKQANINKKNAIVVGDNVFDDMFAAVTVGIKCVLVNHYNSKIKAIVCKFVNRKYLK